MLWIIWPLNNNDPSSGTVSSRMLAGMLSSSVKAERGQPTVPSPFTVRTRTTHSEASEASLSQCHIPVVNDSEKPSRKVVEVDSYVSKFRDHKGQTHLLGVFPVKILKQHIDRKDKCNQPKLSHLIITEK